MTDWNSNITLTVSRSDALSIRIACNETGSAWTTRGHEDRAAGNDEGADTCFRLAAGYSRIWDMVAKAMDAPAPAPDARLAWFDEASL
jgi:hypothetical protein